MVGRTLLHYRIDSLIGEGGMGVVYRAHDTHLNRSVAIKFLKAEAASRPDRIERFSREAKAVSALNHPNILTIHDIDQIDGRHFIVMEFVDGRTLDAAIAHKGLRLAEALPFAAQIAAALAAAHSAGIIHRDLKPANIMVTAPGLVKVLDFGLAKLADPGASSEDATASGHLARTEDGVIVGTAAYMSPEQAEARPVDARSDIFSFGAVLYEMLTGRRAFRGDSKMSTLAAILTRDPQPAHELVPGLPREVERVLMRCLRKDPARRFQTAADLKVSLDELAAELDAPHPPESASAPPKPRRWLPWMAAAVLLAAVSGGLTWYLARSPAPQTNWRIRRLTLDPGLSTSPAISADGKLVAFSSDRSGEDQFDIYVMQIAGGEPVRLTRHPAYDGDPDFSPDGSKLAFRSERDGGGIFIVPALGGEEKLLVKGGLNPRFSPDGSQIVYWSGQEISTPNVPKSGQLYIVASNGGSPRPFRPDFAVARNPLWTPDGRNILFLGLSDAKIPESEALDWWVAPAAEGQVIRTGVYPRLGLNARTTLVPAGWNTATRRILYSRNNLAQLPLSKDWTVAGPPEQLTRGTAIDRAPAMAQGRIVFSSGSSVSSIFNVSLDPNRPVVTPRAERITPPPGNALNPTLSRDGMRLAFAREDDIWVRDLRTGRESNVTSSADLESWPCISPDGSRVAYLIQDKNGVMANYVAPVGGGHAERICEKCIFSNSWSADSARILIHAGERYRVEEIDVASHQRTVILEKSGLHISGPAWSPDMKWIVFRTFLSDRVDLFVAPYAGPALIPESKWIPLIANQHLFTRPQWSPDGNTVYFHSDRDGSLCVWALRLDPRTKHPSGQPVPVHHLHGRLTLSAFVSVGPQRIVFAAAERTGNLWLMEPEGTGR